jgi:hypothetical protein
MKFLLELKHQNISKGTITQEKKKRKMMVIICNMQLLKKGNTFI